MKKKLLGMMLAAVLVATLFGTVVVAQAKTVTSKNLVAPWTDGTIMDSMKLDGTNYPTDHGIKFGKVAGSFTLVNNDNQVHDIGGGGYFANTALPLTKNLTSAATSYTVSAKVTPAYRGEWGGAGIVFGMCESMPVSLWVSEVNSFIVSMNNNEFNKVVGADNAEEKAAFAIDTAYTIKVVSNAGLFSFYYNDLLLESDVDFALSEITPAVGPAQKNYRATYEDFSITIEEEALELVSYEPAENLAMDGMGLYDVYSVELAAQQPFPQEWGIRVAKVNGAYMRTNNVMEPAASDNHGATFFGTSKNVSAVENYMVSANILATKKNNWGGIGITIGKDLANGYPIVMWVCMETADADSPLGTITLGYELNEWKKSVAANAFEPAIGTAFNLAAVVHGNSVSAYVDGVLAGEAMIDIDFEPAVGIDFKNYQGEFTDVTFKTLEADLAVAKYNVSFVSGGVELRKSEYTVGTALDLAGIERNGYTFGGWKIMPNLSGSSVTSVPNSTAGDVFVYCEYAIKTYTIKYFDGDNEITDSGNDSIYDIRAFVDFKAISKDGREFLGWYNNKEFTGDAIESIQIGSHGDMTLYAKFEEEVVGGNDEKKGCEGCGSAMTTTSVVTGIVLIALVFSIIFIVRRKRKED